MVDCKMCGHPYCEHAGTQRGIVIDCANFTPKRKPTTNADRIRSMSDEELADLFSEIADEGLSCTLICTNYDKCKRNNAIEVICRNHYLDWLKQPAKDGETDEMQV